MNSAAADAPESRDPRSCSRPTSDELSIAPTIVGDLHPTIRHPTSACLGQSADEPHDARARIPRQWCLTSCPSAQLVHPIICRSSQSTCRDILFDNSETMVSATAAVGERRAGVHRGTSTTVSVAAVTGRARALLIVDVQGLHALQCRRSAARSSEGKARARPHLRFNGIIVTPDSRYPARDSVINDARTCGCIEQPSLEAQLCARSTRGMDCTVRSRSPGAAA